MNESNIHRLFWRQLHCHCANLLNGRGRWIWTTAFHNIYVIIFQLMYTSWSVKMVEVDGLEPSTFTLSVWLSNRLIYTSIKMVLEEGLEPSRLKAGGFSYYYMFPYPSYWCCSLDYIITIFFNLGLQCIVSEPYS